MNLFNFKNKSNNGVSEETIKAYWEFKQQEKLNLPTKEEAIKIISSVFTPNQLKQLEVTHKGQTITFEEQLLVEFAGYITSVTEDYIKQEMKVAIKKHENIFEFAEQEAKILVFIGICRDFFVRKD